MFFNSFQSFKVLKKRFSLFFGSFFSLLRFTVTVTRKNFFKKNRNERLTERMIVSYIKAIKRTTNKKHLRDRRKHHGIQKTFRITDTERAS